MPQADIEAQLTQFQNQLKTYIENQNPDSTVGEVLGLQEIKILPPRPLAAGLPYNRIITSQTFNEVPNNLRHKFKYTLATENMGYADSPFITIEEPTAKLAGKAIALSFKPATKADEDIIASRLPAPEANGSIDPNKLPKTLPGYLINLTAEFTINGENIKSGAAGKMGGELYEEMGLWNPKEGWQTSVNHPTAGSYRAIGLDLQGASPEQAARLKQQLEATKAKLESNDDIQLATLTKPNLIGDLLYGTVFNYFALNDLQDKIAAQSSNVLSYRLPSYGTFSTNLQTQYWYGLPRNVTFSGLSMDIDHMKQHRVSKTNNKQESIEFSESIGARMSAMEHQVPEEMFRSPAGTAEGVSTIKVLVLASQQGQKIWTIDRNNLNVALNKIQLGAEAEADIRNSVNAGKIVTTHENRINFNGWIGEGYMVIDTNTGAGGYLISGGHNGYEGEPPEDDPSGVNMIAAVAPALVMTMLPCTSVAASATFFGSVKCNLSEVAVTIVVVIALAAVAFMFARYIKAAALIPGIIDVGTMIKTAILSALTLAMGAKAEETYERNCECASEIVSEYGQCWICSKEKHAEIKARQKINRAFQTNYGGCKAWHSPSDIAVRIDGWTEIVNQRTEEIACWMPEHDGHLKQRDQAISTLQNCISMPSR